MVKVYSGYKTREVLTANRTYYVRTDGSDSNNGLSDTSGGAFLTIQKAIDVVASLDISIYNVTIQLGDGTYNETVILKSFSGAGKITIKGNETTPANVILPGNSTNCILMDNVRGTYEITGIKITNANTPGNGIYARKSYLRIGKIDFGSVTRNQLTLEHGALCDFIDNYTISGGGYRHIYAWFDAMANYTGLVTGKTITVTGTPAFSLEFASARYKGGIAITSSNFTFSGSATGIRYLVSENSIILATGVTFPGGIAGTTATGGQYL